MAENRESNLTPEEIDEIQREVLQFAGVGLFRYTFDGTILFIDRGALAILELEDRYPNPADAVGKNVSELVTHVLPVGTIRNRMRQERRVRDLAYPFRTQRGNLKWAAHTSCLVRDPRSGEESIQVFLQDITERRRTEEALCRSEERFRRLVEHAGDIIYQTNAEGCFVYVNPMAIRTLGFPVEEILGRHYSEFVRPDARDAVREYVRAEQRAGRCSVYQEFPVLSKDGQEVWVGQNLEILKNEDLVTGFQAVCRDITRQKQAEHALRIALDRFEAVIEHTPLVAIQGFDRDGVVCHWNGASGDLYGYAARETVGKRLGDLLLSPDDARDFESIIAGIWRSGTATTPKEWPVRTHSGEVRWVYSSMFPVFDGTEVAEVFCMDVDITQRRRAEEALCASEEKYRELVESANSIILRRRPDGRITFFNEYAQQFFDYSEPEILGKHMVGTVVPGLDSNGRDLAAMIDDIGRNPERYSTNENENIRRNGERVWVAWTNKAIRDEHGNIKEILCIGNDVTAVKQAEQERRLLEAQMQHAQRLESLAALAGGVAHDFNNLLVGILGYAEMALLDLSADAPARECLRQIESSAKRAAELTHQLLTYAGRGRLARERVDLGKLLGEMAHLLQVSVPRKVRLHLEAGDRTPLIQGDGAQLRQLVLSLVVNAVDAMNDRAGSIYVQTGVRTYDREFLLRVRRETTLAPGQYVFLRVADTGCGMDAEMLERIFDPFFTTKFIGRGLGLAAVLGTVRGHRGGIHVESRPAEGTTFEVLFPICAAVAEPVIGAEEDSQAEWRGRGTVLVVDDEEPVLGVAKAFLERAGLVVITACDGGEGLEIFSTRAAEIDAVLLDVSMPVRDGDELFALIRGIRPDIPVVFSSGHSEQVNVTSHGDGFVGFVRKPYHARDLLNEIRKALGQ